MRQDEARQALDAISGARASIAQSLRMPLWRHVAFGVAEGSLLLGISARAGPLSLGIPLSIIVAAWLVDHDRRTTGLFVNGWRRGRTLPLALAQLAVMIGLGAMAIHLPDLPVPGGTPWLFALLGLIAGTGASLLAQRLYLAELQHGGEQ